MRTGGALLIWIPEAPEAVLMVLTSTLSFQRTLFPCLPVVLSLTLVTSLLSGVGFVLEPIRDGPVPNNGVAPLDPNEKAPTLLT